MNAFSTWAATAVSASVWPSGFPETGVKTLTLTESQARDYRVGGYVELGGRWWKVASKKASQDWFKDEYYVRLIGAGYAPGGQFVTLLETYLKFPERINWLDDDYYLQGRPS